MMGVMARTSQTADFVHRSDTDADQSGTPGPDAQWLLAAGQPAGATRFRVRPLSVDEYDSVRGSLQEGTGGEAAQLTREMALISINDEPPDDIAAGWDGEIMALVLGVTQSPLAGRLLASRISMDEQPKVSDSGEPLPESP